MKYFAALTAGLMLAACATTPQNGGAQTASADGARSSSGNGQRCESQPVTGSRMTKKICHSDEEWDAMRDRGEEATREIQQMPGGGFEH